MKKIEFKDFNTMFQAHFKEMSTGVGRLFKVDLDIEELWNHYLNSFAPEDNKMYRKRREMDCSCCRHFVKSMGDVIAIKDGKISTMWDFTTNSQFDQVLKALDMHVRMAYGSNGVSGLFLHYNHIVGTEKSLEMTDDGVVQWNHFNVSLPNYAIKNKDAIAEIRGDFNTDLQVFERALKEITLDAINTVLDLIQNNALYRGEQNAGVLGALKTNKIKYDAAPCKNLYILEHTRSGSLARVINSSIGTLLKNLSEDMDVEIAVKKYEDVVAPHNYQRSKPVFTQKMLDDARKKVDELGFKDSLARRVATVEDLNISNSFFIDRTQKSTVVLDNDPFASLEKEVSVNPKKIRVQEEIGINEFVNETLALAKNVEVLLENKFKSNMMTMTTATHPEAPSMFKWDNPFAWSYDGGLADSSMKENVKKAGGKVDGVLRFSIQWNECGSEHNDFDAHCFEPSGREIYFGKKKSHTDGNLDVDIISPYGVAVENITWPRKDKMDKGNYLFFVHNFDGTNRNGFRAEIEIDGEIHTYEYNKPVRSGAKVEVASVFFDGNEFMITNNLPSDVSSSEIWGLTTNQFVPVSGVCESPNHWGDNNAGNRHTFFFLKDCVSPDAIGAFYNEYLSEDLRPHRKVFESLGVKMMSESVKPQLSGIGFSSTKRNDLIVRVDGKVMKVII